MLKIQSPPPLEVVLRHINIVTKTHSQLDRWIYRQTPVEVRNDHRYIKKLNVLTFWQIKLNRAGIEQRQRVCSTICGSSNGAAGYHVTISNRYTWYCPRLLPCCPLLLCGCFQVFQSLFRFLGKNWSNLSPAVKRRLRHRPLVPVGARLIKAGRLFFRLKVRL